MGIELRKGKKRRTEQCSNVALCRKEFTFRKRFYRRMKTFLSLSAGKSSQTALRIKQMCLNKMIYFHTDP